MLRDGSEREIMCGRDAAAEEEDDEEEEAAEVARGKCRSAGGSVVMRAIATSVAAILSPVLWSECV